MSHKATQPGDAPDQHRDIPNQHRDIPNQQRDIPDQQRDIPDQQRDIPDEHGTVCFGREVDGAENPVTMATRFVNLRFHARGGLGEVFLAHDSSLNREVAVKFIRPSRAGEESCRAQFYMEGEITSRLDHPGVVPVYGLGETFDGRPFLAMRFIEGVTLWSAIDAYHSTTTASPHERRRDLIRLLSHLIAACNAVAYAHSRGILHRDIKPDNIMIGKFNETLVVDWGLAVPILRDQKARNSGEPTLHIASSGSDNSCSQPAAGTIGYFSPEAINAAHSPLGPASDIYSLGATLYYLLTGRRSVSGSATAEVLQVIRRGEFPPPRAVNRSISRSLDAICRKAMALEPAQRYATPLEMVADIESYIADDPVSVLPESTFEKLWRYARHHRGLVLSGLVGLLAVAVISSFSGVWLKRQANLEREARDEAVLAKRDSLRLAATFAAQTVAGEIDVRWRILEGLAADPILRELLSKAQAGDPNDPAWRQLQKWLSARQHDYDGVGADSWFLLGPTGLQIARHPYQRQTIGKDFSSRDYFHGMGCEIREPSDAEPLRGPHLSTAYVSSSDKHLKIAYSVPVWPLHDDPHLGKPLGVLAMTARAGEFRILKRGLSVGQNGVLVDLRRCVDETGGERSGLVLHHPELSRRQAQRIAVDGKPGMDFFEADTVLRLERMLQARLLSIDEDETESLTAGDEPGLEASYIDPLSSEKELLWEAAFEPVVIVGRQPPQRETSLIVIVQQRLHRLP
jgi:serine/threonine protein kinase